MDDLFEAVRDAASAVPARTVTDLESIVSRHRFRQRRRLATAGAALAILAGLVAPSLVLPRQQTELSSAAPVYDPRMAVCYYSEECLLFGPDGARTTLDLSPVVTSINALIPVDGKRAVAMGTHVIWPSSFNTSPKDDVKPTGSARPDIHRIVPQSSERRLVLVNADGNIARWSPLHLPKGEDSLIGVTSNWAYFLVDPGPHGKARTATLIRHNLTSDVEQNVTLGDALTIPEWMETTFFVVDGYLLRSRQDQLNVYELDTGRLRTSVSTSTNAAGVHVSSDHTKFAIMFASVPGASGVTSDYPWERRVTLGVLDLATGALRTATYDPPRASDQWGDVVFPLAVGWTNSGTLRGAWRVSGPAFVNAVHVAEWPAP